MEIRLRRPESDDLASIVNFELELAKYMGSFRNDPVKTANFCRLRVEEFGSRLKFYDPKFNIILAEIDGRTAGYVNYSSLDNRIHINSFYVTPEFWRRGIGRKILTALIGEASYKRKCDISVVPTFNARPFYSKFGFENCDKYVRGGMIFKFEKLH